LAAPTASEELHLASWALPSDLQTAAPAADEVVLTAARAKVENTIWEASREMLAAEEVTNAFAAGMEQPALQTFFNQFCVEATDDIETSMREGMLNKEFPPEEADVPLACNPDVYTDITDVSFNGLVSCDVAFADGQVEVTVNMPEIEMDVHGHGSCKDTVLGICVSEVIIEVEADAIITGMSALFPITEDQFLTGGETTALVTPGTADVVVVDDSGTEVNCLSGVVIAILDFLADVFEFLVTVLTLGFVNPDWDVEVELTGWTKEIDITSKLGILDLKVEVPAITLNNDPVTAAGLSITTDIDDVDISTGGLAALFKATFSPTSEDPEILETEGAVLTPAPAPLPPQGEASEALYMAIADDTFNQLFASMTAQGMFKSTCLPQTMTFGDLLPDDCDTLDSNARIGACHGAKGDVCSSLPLTQRPSCNAMQTLLENRNISADQDLMICMRQDIPPNLLIQDDASTENEVEIFLRLNDLFAAVLIERDSTEGIDTPDLAGVPNCFNSETQLNDDCKLLAACLDLNIEAKLVLDTSGDEPAFDMEVVGAMPEPSGVVCEGGIDVGDSDALSDIGASNPIDDIESDADSLTPDIGSDGLGLGGNIEFVNPRLLGVETGADPNFHDYLMIIGEVADP
jgi:hypothetical protein